MRLSEAASVKAQDFNWEERTVIALGKGNKYRKALAGNGLVRQWFSGHGSFEISPRGIQTMLKRLSKETGIKCNPHSFRRGMATHNLKSGLSTRIVQALGGWETIAMVEHYSKSLAFGQNSIISSAQGLADVDKLPTCLVRKISINHCQ